MELVCTQGCNKYAKYRFQKLKAVRIHDKSNRKFIQVYEVEQKSKPCNDCGALVQIESENHICTYLFETGILEVICP